MTKNFILILEDVDVAGTTALRFTLQQGTIENINFRRRGAFIWRTGPFCLIYYDLYCTGLLKHESIVIYLVYRSLILSDYTIVIYLVYRSLILSGYNIVIYTDL